MSTPPYYPESGEPGALGVLAQAFTGQEGTDVAGGLVERAARYLSGDPAGNIFATSPNFTVPSILPDLPGVKSALVYVDNSSINARWDGSVPVADSDFFIPQGSYIILTGVPSIKGFQFVSVGLAAANLFGCYFT